MARVSYSQYSTYSSCPQKYKLKYIDKNKTKSGIHAIFGSAVHTTVQSFLEVYYNNTVTAARNMDLEADLKMNLVDEFNKANAELPDGEFVCTREEIEEFYWQGVEIIRWFKSGSNLRKFFKKKGCKLVGIEIPVKAEIRKNVNVIGFIDVVLEDDKGNTIIIDLKTSTTGWSKWQKNDESKKNQIILYKVWYSNQYNVDIDTISVEFHIMKRIVPPEEEQEWPVHRITKFSPPSGKIKQGQAKSEFNWFVNEVFDDGGEYIDKDYVKKPGRHCDWCDFHKVLCSGAD